MRLYHDLSTAMSEIRRDLAKAPKLISSRVQHMTNQVLPGREMLGYTYALEVEGIPSEASDLVELGTKLGLKLFVEKPATMVTWLREEWRLRSATNPLGFDADQLHPALEQTLEGNWPSYTYGERLAGAYHSMMAALTMAPDTRRAYWPIFRPEDSARAAAPTRIPCSLGYQALIRKVLDEDRLILYYLQRSADFDTFFITDIWFAAQFLRMLAKNLGVPPGQLMHTIISLHSFTVEGTEIY